MSDRVKVNLAKYGGCALFVALMAWLYISPRDFANATLVDQYRYLCDAFTVPGLLLILLGGMIWASNLGALHGLLYALRWAMFSLIPGKRWKRDETYGEYVERQNEKRVTGYSFLFYSGLVTMAIALVFMALFYSLYE